MSADDTAAAVSAEMALESMRQQRDELAEALRAVAKMDPNRVTTWGNVARAALAKVQVPS